MWIDLLQDFKFWDFENLRLGYLVKLSILPNEFCVLMPDSLSFCQSCQTMLSSVSVYEASEALGAMCTVQPSGTGSPHWMPRCCLCNFDTAIPSLPLPAPRHQHWRGSTGHWAILRTRQACLTNTVYTTSSSFCCRVLKSWNILYQERRRWAHRAESFWRTFGDNE